MYANAQDMIDRFDEQELIETTDKGLVQTNAIVVAAQLATVQTLARRAQCFDLQA